MHDQSKLETTNPKNEGRSDGATPDKFEYAASKFFRRPTSRESDRSVCPPDARFDVQDDRRDGRGKRLFQMRKLPEIRSVQISRRGQRGCPS